MGNYETIGQYEYNPIHGIWRCLTTLGMAETWLNGSSFLESAITIYNEGKGVAMNMNTSQPCLAYLTSLLSHVNGILYYGEDGTFHMKLIRKDYTIASLPVVQAEDLLDFPTVERGSWIETTSEIKVQYNRRFYVTTTTA